MLRQLYNFNPTLRSPIKISCARFAKYTKYVRQTTIDETIHMFLLYPKRIEEQEEGAKVRALKSFDDLYEKVYKDTWPSMRVGLLCPSKKALLVNNYSDVGRIINELEDKCIISVTNLYETQLAELAGSEDGTRSVSDLETDFSNVRQGDNYDEDMEKEYIKKFRADNNEDELIHESSHLGKKLHEDPSVYIPLEETLAAAKMDKSRIVEPQATGTALSAALYEFVPATEVMGRDPDWILNADRYREYEKSTNVLVDMEPDAAIHFPPRLLVYSYERGSVEDYESARLGSSRTIDYAEIELGNLLPVLALGIEPGDRVLDMCTQSTDFGLMMLQSLYPDLVTMNIHSDVRIGALHSQLQITFRGSEHAKYKVLKELPKDVQGDYNKILLCVPNLNDRSCMESTQTYFHPMLSRQRLLLPDVQADHLIEAIRLVQLGGTVVYCTTTLSPLQNEGVVRTAVGRLRYEHGIHVVVKDLTQTLKPLDTFFKFASRKVVSIGHLVVPFLPLNCGPLYFCKLVKTAVDDESSDDETPTS